MRKCLLLFAMMLLTVSIEFAQESPVSHYAPLRTIRFEDYTALRAYLYIDGVLQQESQYEIGVKCGEQIRGCAFLNDSKDACLYNIGMRGQEGDNFTFTLFDHRSGGETQTASPIVLETTRGSGYGLSTPVSLNFFTSRTLTFSNNDGDSWNTLANWNGATSLPDVHDKVIINGTCVADGATDISVHSIIINTGCLLEVEGLIISTTETRVEDGGQLYLNEGMLTGVLSVKKNIRAYEDGSDNYYLIASPLAESTVSPAMMRTQMRKKELGDRNFDLYYFDESQPNEEWQNYRTHEFDLAKGQGYLYEYGDGTSIVFMGTPNVSSEPLELPYDTEKMGYSLLGNPFTCNAVVNSNKESTQYATLNENHDGFIELTGDVILMPCTAVFVRAMEAGTVITFTPYLETLQNP